MRLFNLENYDPRSDVEVALDLDYFVMKFVKHEKARELTISQLVSVIDNAASNADNRVSFRMSLGMKKWQMLRKEVKRDYVILCRQDLQMLEALR